MVIELSYRYSDLDKRQEFGLVTEGHNETYIRWLWFFLGTYLGPYSGFQLYPFSQTGAWKGRVLKSYKYHTDARKQALLIANRIHKIVNSK